MKLLVGVLVGTSLLVVAGWATDISQLQVNPNAVQAAPQAQEPTLQLQVDPAVTQQADIKRLKSDVRELRATVSELGSRLAAMEAKLTEIEGVSVFHCEGTVSVSASGGRTECSPYACNKGTGQCFRPLCGKTDECAGGFVCDVGSTSLCIAP